MGSYKYCICFTRKFRWSEAQPPADVKEMFASYADGGATMGADHLGRYLANFHADAGDGVEAERVIERIRQLRTRMHLSRIARPLLVVEDFHHFLFSEELNPPILSQADPRFIWNRNLLEELIETKNSRNACHMLPVYIHEKSSLLRSLSKGGAVSMMLENSNDALPGVFSANVSLHFYRGAASFVESQNLKSSFASHPSIKGLYREPADLILPVSNSNGYYGSGFWFRVNDESGLGSSTVTIPRNAYRAVLEIFVSYHGDDEFWYMNPLRSTYLQTAQNLSAPRSNCYMRTLNTVSGVIMMDTKTASCLGIDDA